MCCTHPKQQAASLLFLAPNANQMYSVYPLRCVAISDYRFTWQSIDWFASMIVAWNVALYMSRPHTCGFHRLPLWWLLSTPSSAIQNAYYEYMRIKNKPIGYCARKSNLSIAIVCSPKKGVRWYGKPSEYFLHIPKRVPYNARHKPTKHTNTALCHPFIWINNAIQWWVFIAMIGIQWSGEARLSRVGQALAVAIIG